MGETTSSGSCVNKDRSSVNYGFLSLPCQILVNATKITLCSYEIMQLCPPVLSFTSSAHYVGHCVKLPCRPPGFYCMSMRVGSVSVATFTRMAIQMILSDYCVKTTETYE